MTKKVFIKTFGCQMNEYDSDKMADVLGAAEGYEPTQDVEEADLILFNTCSVREKAQEKVFSDLGRVKHHKARGALIGVGGCVASQEGEEIIKRAPYVDIVFGPQTLHRLPQLLAERERTRKPRVDISFPEIEKFDHLPPARVEGASAFVSIMEGCSKYCSYCVVPYTRGDEVSRPLGDVLTEVAGLAAQGVKEVNLLGQNVNAWRGDDGDFDQHVLEGAREFLAARVRHHAVVAVLAAAFHDRDEGARALDLGRGQVVELLDLGEADVHLGPVLRTACVQQFGQAVQGLGAKHHVHIGGALDDLDAFLAGHAAAYANLHAARLQVLDAAQVAEDLFLGLFAHRAGVEQDEVGLVHVLRGLVALGGAQHVHHLVRVVLVHLAAEGFDKDFFGHGNVTNNKQTPLPTGRGD